MSLYRVNVIASMVVKADNSSLVDAIASDYITDDGVSVSYEISEINKDNVDDMLPEEWDLDCIPFSDNEEDEEPIGDILNIHYRGKS